MVGENSLPTTISTFIYLDLSILQLYYNYNKNIDFFHLYCYTKRERRKGLPSNTKGVLLCLLNFLFVQQTLPSNQVLLPILRQLFLISFGHKALFYQLKMISSYLICEEVAISLLLSSPSAVTEGELFVLKIFYIAQSLQITVNLYK